MAGVSYAIGKAPIRAGVATRGAKGMVERMSIFGRPLSPGEVRWLATCSGTNNADDKNSSTDNGTETDSGSETSKEKQQQKKSGGKEPPVEDEAEGEEPLWEPTAPHPFLYGVSQGGTTAPSGAVAPVTLPSHVDGYAEHVDVNHRPYWQALPTAPTAQLAEAFNAPPPEPPDSESDSDTDAEEATQQQEEGEQSEPEPNRYQKLPPGSGGSGGGSMVPAPRLMRRPSKPPQHATPPFASVGAIASGRSVFTRRMPWALKLKLKLDSAEVGLLHTWRQPDDLNDQSLAAVATEYDTAFLLSCSLFFLCLSRACLGKSISFLHHLPKTI